MYLFQANTSRWKQCILLVCPSSPIIHIIGESLWRDEWGTTFAHVCTFKQRYNKYSYSATAVEAPHSYKKQQYFQEHLTKALHVVYVQLYCIPIFFGWAFRAEQLRLRVAAAAATTRRSNSRNLASIVHSSLYSFSRLFCKSQQYEALARNTSKCRCYTIFDEVFVFSLLQHFGRVEFRNFFQVATRQPVESFTYYVNIVQNFRTVEV